MVVATRINQSEVSASVSSGLLKGYSTTGNLSEGLCGAVAEREIPVLQDALRTQPPEAWKLR